MTIMEHFDAGSFVMGADMTTGDIKYFQRVPAHVSLIPEGRVAVHNQVVMAKQLGVRGFRAWHEKLTDKHEPCPCSWAPHLGTHYRLKATHNWTEEQRAASDARAAWRHEVCTLAAQFAADLAYDGAMESLIDQEDFQAEDKGSPHYELEEIFQAAMEGYDITEDDVIEAQHDFEAAAKLNELFTETVPQSPGRDTQANIKTA